MFKKSKQLLTKKMSSPSDEILKQAIMEIKEPVLFQRMLQDITGAYTWKLLEWNLVELAEKFGNCKLPFRVGYNKSMVNYYLFYVFVCQLMPNVNVNQFQNFVFRVHNGR